MVDLILAAVAIGVSLVLSLLMLRLQPSASPDRRLMMGFASTVVHMIGSLAFSGLLLLVVKPAWPLGFVLGVLVFYLVSLIILVVTIVRWMRAGSTNPSAPSAAADQNRKPLE